jgi:hypothetical protein
MADEAIYRPASKTMSPEMDAWLKRARKKQKPREPSQSECINAPAISARAAIRESARRNAALGIK